MKEPGGTISKCSGSGSDASKSKGLLPCQAMSHSAAVKAALHLSAVPDTILCRELEQQQVVNFCKDCIRQQISGSLYICGCPGTGKSLTMEKLKVECGKWAEEIGTGAPEIVVLNCTSVSKPEFIYDRVLQLLQPGDSQRLSNARHASCLREIKRLSTYPGPKNHRRMLLLILDEVDYLITRDQSVLHNLFQLSTLPNSRCILIGIANSIDLTDRLLPKLHALNCKPDVITFPAYTSDQILLVMKQRLQALPFAVFDLPALELCARKVAASSGDMRKAVHVCRLAFETVEAESRNVAEQPAQECKVRIDDMARALARTFQSPVVQTIQSLPRHQQMVLCAAVRLFGRAKQDCSLGELNSRYVEFCKSTVMPALSTPEFCSLCRVLADQALIKLSPSREERLRRVSLQVDQNDVVFALEGIRFFRTIFSEDKVGKIST